MGTIEEISAVAVAVSAETTAAVVVVAVVVVATASLRAPSIQLQSMGPVTSIISLATRHGHVLIDTTVQ